MVKLRLIVAAIHSAKYLTKVDKLANISTRFLVLKDVSDFCREVTFSCDFFVGEPG